MPKDTKTLCIKKGCASVLTQPQQVCCLVQLAHFYLRKVIVLKINRDLLSMNGIIIFTDLNFEKE